METVNSDQKLAPERRTMDVFVSTEESIDLAVDDSENMTYEIYDIANKSLEEQIQRIRDFNKTGLVTENFVRKSITDIDHWPYTRRYRGAPTLCDATIMDRAAGFRPVQNACYATQGIITSMANLTGTTGFLCGTPLHKSGLGIGGNQASEYTTAQLSNPFPGKVPGQNMSWRQQRGVEEDPFQENFTVDERRKRRNRLRTAVGIMNRNPLSASSAYPRYTSVDGVNAYAQVAGSAAYPTTCFQGSCTTGYPCHSNNGAPHFPPLIRS